MVAIDIRFLHADLIFVYIVDETVPLTIGLQQGYYSTLESNDLLQVCVEVTSGAIAGRNISLNYTTIDGSAEGMHRLLH